MSSKYVFAMAVSVAILNPRLTIAEENPDVVKMEAAVLKALREMEAEPEDAKKADDLLRQNLYAAINKYAYRLRPKEGSKRYKTADGRFVLVVGANGWDAFPGTAASASDDKARLVVAYAGGGERGARPTPPPSAGASAPKGIAIAIAGSPNGRASADGKISSFATGPNGTLDETFKLDRKKVLEFLKD